MEELDVMDLELDLHLFKAGFDGFTMYISDNYVEMRSNELFMLGLIRRNIVVHVDLMDLSCKKILYSLYTDFMDF